MKRRNTSFRWLRFSLRTLLVIFSVLVLSFGIWVSSAKEQQQIVALIHDLGGNVQYEHELTRDTEGHLVSRTNLRSPNWTRQVLGIDYFESVRAATVGDVQSNVNIQHKESLGAAQTKSKYSKFAAKLYKLSHLESLSLANLPVSDEDFATIGTHFLKLERLWLWNVHVTDTAANYVGKLNQLESLHLYETGISNRGLESLENLTNLTLLSLGGVSITDDSLKHLKPLEKLQHLSLLNASVTDSGLVHLLELTNLKRGLRLESCLGISDDGISYLRTNNINVLVVPPASMSDP